MSEASVSAAEPAGLGPRRLGCDAIAEVLRSRAALDDVLEARRAAAALSARETRLEKGLPRDERLLALLAAGAAQVLYLDVPDHAAVDTGVAIARSEPRLQGFAGLVNAVLRRLAREADEIRASDDALRINTPAWLAERWTRRYGEERAQAIAQAHARGASLDLTVKHDAAGWAQRLGGSVLPTGSVRVLARTPVPELEGYGEGAWWVQDAAAALPARLLDVKPGERVADLCAAPGGKTAQLAAAGADVLAVDRSAKRLERLKANMARLGAAVETRAADAATLETEPFDAILLDAPCSATGTLRRHPDAAWTKRPADLEGLTALQARLLERAGTLVRPGGRLVYCTCSLEPEEGEDQIAAFLARRPEFARAPIAAEEIGLPEGIDGSGDLRTLPCHALGPRPEERGLDGFFVARLTRKPA